MLKISRINTYKDILWLVLKYARSDIVNQAGIQAKLQLDQQIDCGNGKPQELAADLESMGPAFIKLGQLLSTRGDLLPPAYLEALSRLQDDVAPIPFDVVNRIVAEELKLPINDVFQWFDSTPLASASLGQVHRARLRNDRDVAVKVQRPDIIEGIDRHIAAMRDFAQTFESTTDIGKRYGFTRTVDLLERTLTQELDYRYEAHHAEAFAVNLKQFKNIVVPAVVSELSTQRILTMDYIPGRKITELSNLQLMEIPGEALAAELFRASLHELLVDGFFHADPHPGNLLLTDDNRIAFLDLGMVGRLSGDERDRLIRLLLALSEGRAEDVAQIASQIGIQTDQFDRTCYVERITGMARQHQEIPMEQLRIGSVIMEIQKISAETGMLVPDSTVMLGKGLMNLERVVRTLDPHFDAYAAMRDGCRQLMPQRTLQEFSLAKFYHAFLDANNLIQALPDRLNRITEVIADNQLRVRVDAFDERYLMKGLQKVANRITAGLVLAAIIIGASLLMRLDASWKLFGYPAIAMLFFLTAAVLSLWLVVRTMFCDE